LGQVRCGIIGTGRYISPGNYGGIARLHLKGYLTTPDAALTGFYDVIPENAVGWAKQHGVSDVPVYTDLDEFLRHVDAVSICTPNSTHRELSRKCLEAGVAVLCEKPMTTTLAEGRAMAAEAEASGGTHMIGFSYRRVPAVLYTRELYQSGTLGELFWVRLQFSGDRTAGEEIGLEWRFQRDLSGNGAMADFGSHCIDITEFILGPVDGRIESVIGSAKTRIPARSAEDGAPRSVENDDTSAFIADLACGATASFQVSRIGYGGWIMFELAGSAGAIRWDGARPDRVELRLKQDRGPYLSAWQEVAVPPEFLPGRPAFLENPIELEVAEFVAAVRDGRKVRPDFADGARVQQVIEAVARACATGCRIRPNEV